jgi:hypothetical protein
LRPEPRTRRKANAKIPTAVVESGVHDKPRQLSPPSSTPGVAIPPIDTLAHNAEESIVHIATFIPEDSRLIPMWHYSELLDGIDDGRSEGGDLAKWTKEPLDTSEEAKIVLSMSEELQVEHTHDTDATATNSDQIRLLV